jgi:serine protease Do
VVGMITSIMSPGGEPTGLTFALPWHTAMPVLEQLKQYGEARRGWLGVRIQQVTDEVAESLNIKPPRGALIAGIDDKGPAKPAGLEPGDVIVKFDGRDVNEMRDLPRIIAETPVGKSTQVIVIRKGKEEGKVLTLGRLEEAERLSAAETKPDAPLGVKAAAPAAKAASPAGVKKTLGIALANMSADLRQRYKIKDMVKGVVAIDVDAGSMAADKRLSAGDVIVEIAGQAVATADDVQAKVDKLKKESRRSALLLVASPDGELRFLAINLQ